jgi:AcrR family transcriptional regulator
MGTARRSLLAPGLGPAARPGRSRRQAAPCEREKEGDLGRLPRSRSRRPAGRPRVDVHLDASERAVLEHWARDPAQAARGHRAELILECAAGEPDRAIAKRHATTADRVGRWRRRFLRDRLAGLSDRPRSGRPPRISERLLDHLLAQTMQKTSRAGRAISARRAAKQFAIGRTTIDALRREVESAARASPPKAPTRIGRNAPFERTSLGLRAAVLGAARELIARGGIEAVTVARLAEAVGVDSGSLYRRWAGAEEIIADVIVPSDRSGSRATPAQRGLAVFLRRTADFYAATLHHRVVPELVRSLLARRATDPMVARTAARLASEGSARFLERYARDCEPDAIEPGTDPLLALELIVGPIVLRSALGVRPVDAAYLDSLVSAAIRGLERRNKRFNR